MEATSPRIVCFIQKVQALQIRYHVDRTLCLCDVLDQMPCMGDRDVDMFLLACYHRGLYDCAILVATHFGRIEQMLSIFKDLYPGYMLDTLLVFFATNGLWCWVKRLLSHYSQKQSVSVLRMLADKPLSDDQLEVFRMLVDRCSDSDVESPQKVVEKVIDGGLAPQFKCLVYSTSETTRQYISKGHLIDLVHKTYMDRFSHGDAKNVFADFNGCLAVACAAGLFSAFSSHKNTGAVTPMSMAVWHNQPDLVKFLYSTGSVSNREVFTLSNDKDLMDKAGRCSVGEEGPVSEHYPSNIDEDAAKEIRRFLLDKASNPASFEELCFSQVSRQVGWGHAREANIEKLHIPKLLKDDLKFERNKALLKYKNE